VFFVHKLKGKDRRRLSLRLKPLLYWRVPKGERGDTSSIFFILTIDPQFTIYAQSKVS
jgi:hypothetical protein